MPLEKTWVPIALAAAVLACTAVSAQAPQQESADSPVLQEVTVTATRRAESTQNIAVAITAISGEQLSQAGVTDTRDLVALAPNLSTQGSFGRTAPAFFIRGIGSTQFNTNANSKVGIYVDDVYLNSTAVHGAQLFDIERVEIARGPQGYLFGQNTTGGLVRTIVSKPKPGEGFTADVGATYGRFGQFDVDAALGSSLGDRAAWRLAVLSQQSDGYQKNEFLGRRAGDTDMLAGRVQLLLLPTEDVRILLNVHGSRDHSGLSPYKQLGLVDPLSGAPCATPGLGSGCTDFFGYADSTDYHRGQWDVPNQLTHVDAGGASVTIDWALGGATFSSVSAYERNRSRINEDTDVSPLDVVHGSYTGDPKQYSQELRITSSDEGATRWIGGLYYFNEDFKGSAHFAARGFGPGGLSGGLTPALEGIGQVSAMKTDSYAAFGNVDHDLTERFKLSLGLRYTHETKDVSYAGYLTDSGTVEPDTLLGRGDIAPLALAQTIDFERKKSWDNVSGRLSLDYRFNPQAMVYVSAARGFNSGNYNGGALFDQSEASLVNPEILKSYELGVKSDLAGNRVRLNADVYYYDFTDQQVFILASGSGGSPIQQLSNAAASSLYGAEAELMWQASERLLLQAGAGYTHSKFDEFTSPIGGDLTGNELPSAPEFNFNALLRYEWPLSIGRLAVSADTKYTGDQFFSVNNDPLLAQHAYWISNARLTFDSREDVWEVSLWAKNLADRDYLVGAFDLAAFGFDQYVVGAPRTYGVTVGYRVH